MSLTHGADAERLKGIAGQLRVQSRRAVAVREDGSGRLGVLQGAWAGEDLESFVRRWQVSARALDECAERLESAAALMLEEADQQIAASDGAGGGSQGLGITMGIGPGAPTGPSGIAPAGPSGPAPTGPPDNSESEGSTFDEDIRGTEGQPVDKDMWELAFHAQGTEHPLHGVPGFGYERPPVPEGYSEVTGSDIEALGLDPASFGADAQPQAYLYETPDGGYVVAFQGSVEGGDWVTNAEQALGFESEQYTAAMELAVEVNDATGGEVTFTGHSLGGGLASAAGMATGQPAVTFDSSGVHPETAAAAAELRGGGATAESVTTEAGQGQMRAYSMSTDGVTTAQEATELPDAPGTQIVLETPESWQRDVSRGAGAVGGAHVGVAVGLFDGEPFDVIEDAREGAQAGAEVGDGAWGHSWDPMTEALEERYPD